MSKIFKPEKLSIKSHSEITEKIIQDIIANDPSIVGLGDLILKDKERMQPKAGRLDLLFLDPETSRRYEVEIQLGKTDECHLVRTIEYWDIERKRYPQYDHCAVIIAEDITSRFLNVISLFNGFIPLIAIQMNAYKFNDQIGLVFTKVLDEMPLGLIEDDEEEDLERTTVNREYWVKKSSEATMKTIDGFLEILNQREKSFVLKYNKTAILLEKEGRPVHFLIIRPRKKNHFLLVIKLIKSELMDKFVENDLVYMEYNTRLSRYRINIRMEDLSDKKGTIVQLVELAFALYNQ